MKYLLILKKDGTIGGPKSSAGVREVPIPINFMPLLKEHRRGPFELVCTTSTGGMYTESNRKNLIKNIKREMNIKIGCRVVRNQLQPPFPLHDFHKTTPNNRHYHLKYSKKIAS